MIILIMLYSKEELQLTIYNNNLMLLNCSIKEITITTTIMTLMDGTIKICIDKLNLYNKQHILIRQRITKSIIKCIRTIHHFRAQFQILTLNLQ